MPGEGRDLTASEDALSRVLADAIVDDLISEGGVWVAVSCFDANDQKELVERLRREGREVRLRNDAA